jgi:uncharacterized membrane protein YjjB (DUF3815 family)
MAVVGHVMSQYWDLETVNPAMIPLIPGLLRSQNVYSAEGHQGVLKGHCNKYSILCIALAPQLASG